MATQGRQHKWLAWLLVAAAASGLWLFSTEGCVSAQVVAPADAWQRPQGAPGQPAATATGPQASGVLAGACLDTPEFGPAGIAATFSEKPFWIVLGLVVLGWLVLAADFPSETH